MRIPICAAAAALASLAIAAPASAKPDGVAIAMASFAAVSAAPDAATREADLPPFSSIALPRQPTPAFSLLVERLRYRA